MAQKILPPDELRQIREIDLGLSRAEMARLLETTIFMVQRWERPADRQSHVPPPHRVVRLLEAYRAGYRPSDWPTEGGAA